MRTTNIFCRKPSSTMLFIFVSSLLTFVVGGRAAYSRDTKRFSVVSDLVPGDCDKNEGYYYTEKAINDCYPGCTQRRANELNCNTKSSCPPGYYCPVDDDKDDEICQVNRNSCYRYYTSTNADYTNSPWKPRCLSDETWAPKQCQGEAANGRCFCFDIEGNRIFGHAFSLDAGDMTCACSRRRSDMERAGTDIFVSLHCDSKGNYERLQCDVNSQQCWCAKPETGALTSPIVPLALMARLPCHDRNLVGSQYLRRCESELYAQKRIADEFNAHGTTRVNWPLHFCQYDGSFGPLRIDRGIAFCVWRDNSNLGSYQAAVSSISTMNCNCARDERIFALAGRTFMLSCLSNGNYSPLQSNGMEYFCVNENGLAVSDLTNVIPDCGSFL